MQSGCLQRGGMHSASAFRRWGGERPGLTPAQQGVEAPARGLERCSRRACERRRLCSWKETRRPAASASKPGNHFSLRQRIHEHAWGGTEAQAMLTRQAGAVHHPTPPAPGLTLHRLWLRVVVGEPGPQAEAGSVGAGPDPGVREGQRRPAEGWYRPGMVPWGEGALYEGCAG